MYDSSHVFCKPCRKHSMFCPCWHHGRFGVDCGVIGFPHIHDHVDINFISTAERLAGEMLIRRKTDQEFEAFQYTGDLTSLFTWLATKNDFVSLAAGKDLTVRITIASSETIHLNMNDFLRVTIPDNFLDKINVANFAANWELV